MTLDIVHKDLSGTKSNIYEVTRLSEDNFKLSLEHEQTLRHCAALIASCVTARLTGTRDPDELYETHVKDCLESIPHLPDREHSRVIDVGSGGGLPGLVWAICRPDLDVTLLDSIGKKCRAVENIASDLRLQNVRVICARAEDFARRERESFDLACARAVASAGITVELLAPLVKIGGTLLTFKGQKLRAELDEVKQEKWQRLGLDAPLILPYGTPGESNRCLVFWKKIYRCPRSYPRQVGMAEKKGWWL